MRLNTCSKLAGVLALVAAACLSAQQQQQPATESSTSTPRTEIGGTIGLGAFNSMHGNFLTAGVEACVRCGGRSGVFLEYSHWQLTPPGGETSVLNYVAGGLRIQGKNRHLRPFFDIGVAMGQYDGNPHDFVHRSESFGTGGIACGAGVAISIGKRLYLRPQVRMAGGLPNGVVVGTFNVGAGHRF